MYTHAQTDFIQSDMILNARRINLTRACKMKFSSQSVAGKFEISDYHAPGNCLSSAKPTSRADNDLR